MMRLLVVTLWLMVGHAVAGAAYLGLIHTPDANVLMLVASAGAVLAGLLALLVTSTTAARALQTGLAPWRAWGSMLALLPAVGLAALLVLGLWWLSSLGEAAWMARRGEVDAAAIAAADYTRTGWIHVTVSWVVAFVQWVLVPSWLASSLAWAVGYGPRYVLSMKWLVAGLHGRVVAAALVAVVLCVWLPWRGAYWRPSGLESSAAELAITGAKLFGLYAAANLGWALVLDAAARVVRR